VPEAGDCSAELCCSRSDRTCGKSVFHGMASMPAPACRFAALAARKYFALAECNGLLPVLHLDELINEQHMRPAARPKWRVLPGAAVCRSFMSPSSSIRARSAAGRQLAITAAQIRKSPGESHGHSLSGVAGQADAEPMVIFAECWPYTAIRPSAGWYCVCVGHSCGCVDPVPR